MKKTLFCLSLLLCGAVHADELANANALVAKKSYPQALQLLTKLANAGNADAQYRLSELYAGSDAGPADPAKAEAWLQKAAAKGNKEALAAQERAKQRAARRVDIDYWLSQYDGSELKSGQYACPAPRFPELSKQTDEIERIGARMTQWEDCFNAFARNLNASAPLTQRIPKDVAALMTKDEMAKATAYLAGVHSRLATDAKVVSKLVLADFDAWNSATSAYVTEHNLIVKEAKKVGATE